MCLYTIYFNFLFFLQNHERVEWLVCIYRYMHFLLYLILINLHVQLQIKNIT